MGNDLEHFQQICDLKTETINTKLDDILIELRGVTKDHEYRIRTIEKDKKSEAAIITAITGILGVIVMFFVKK